MQNLTSQNIELIKIIEALASERSISKSLVIEAMEEALAKAARSRYGVSTIIKAKIDPNTGEQKLWRELIVTDELEDLSSQIHIEDAKKQDENINLGDIVTEVLPPISFGRSSALVAKQVITQKVQSAEKERQFEEFKDRVGEIITGIIKRQEFGHFIVDLGRAEGILRKEQQIQNENLKQGDRIHAYIMDVKKETKDPQIILSRAHIDFMAKLFIQEVPEIYNNIIQIKAIARDPGSRAKIAVHTDDPSIDPIGACVGLKGSRVNTIVNELAGEKIDVVQWSPDIATFVIKALKPAEVSKVVLDEVERKIEIVVKDDQFALAIGRRGQNVRLAAQLTGFEIDIMTEEKEATLRQEEYKQRTSLFMEALDVDDMFAGLLASEGFEEIEEIAFVDENELAEIEGFDIEIVKELQARAKEYLNKENKEYEQICKDLGVSKELMEFPNLNTKMVATLAKNDVKTLEDLATCVVDDLLGWDEYNNGKNSHFEGYLEDFNLSEEFAEELINNARQVTKIFIDTENTEEEATKEESKDNSL